MEMEQRTPEWTPEAQAFLEGYLQQVGALARQGGEDAEDIKAGLRDHIVMKLAESAGLVVSLEVLRRVLAEVGTPEQVIMADYARPETMRADRGASAPNRSPRVQRSERTKHTENRGMSKCPHCNEQVSLSAGPTAVRREISGFIKKEIMYSCPHCDHVLGFGFYLGWGLLTDWQNQ